MKSTILIFCFLFFYFLFLAPLALADTISVDDVRSDYAKGDYRSALQKTSKLFAATLQEPSPADKYALLMLRGECELQLKDRLDAMTAFKSAAKCAADVDQLTIAKANALISERSSMGRYTPRFSTDKTPIDILPIDSRKQAMTALQSDLWSQNKSLIDAAMTAQTLPPIEKAFGPLSDMFCLESAATGQAAQTGKLMHELGQQTYQLMQTEVNRYSRRIDQLNQTANSSSNGDGNWGGVRRGLFSTEKDELKNSAAYLTQLRDRATEYRGIANKLGGNEQKWDSLVLSIDDTLASAEALFNDQ